MSKRTVEQAEKAQDGYESKLKNNYDIIINDIKEKLEKVGITTDSYIEVQFYGHYGGGSYVDDWQVAPGYVNDIEYSTNRKCEWTGRESISCCLGYDAYNFKVYYKQKVHKRPYKPNGKMLRIRSGVPFLSDCGIEWACLYLITKDLLSDKSILKEYGFTYKNDFISIDKQKIACVVRYNNELHYQTGYTSNCIANRILYDCVFDLLINEQEFTKIFHEKHNEVIKDLFKELNIQNSCRRISLFGLHYPNGYYYTLEYDYHLFTKADILTATTRNNEYEIGRKFIALPSGQKVELKNNYEVDRDIYHSLAFQNYSPYGQDKENNNYMVTRIICKGWPQEYIPTKEDFACIAESAKDYSSLWHFKEASLK